MPLTDEMIADGWLPADDMPTGARFRVAHIGDPDSFTDKRYMGERAPVGDEWHCTFAFMYSIGRQQMLTFKPTHYRPEPTP
jgi:hypothetical protein